MSELQDGKRCKAWVQPDEEQGTTTALSVQELSQDVHPEQWFLEDEEQAQDNHDGH